MPVPADVTTHLLYLRRLIEYLESLLAEAEVIAGVPPNFGGHVETVEELQQLRAQLLRFIGFVELRCGDRHA